MRKPSAERLSEQITKGKGNISAVARAFGVPRSHVYGWIKSYPSCQQTLKDMRESVIDDAESILYKMVVDQNMTAVAYVLNNSPEARARGWNVQQTDITSGGQPITQPVTYIKEVRPDND